MKRGLLLLSASMLAFAVTGCDKTKRTLGLEKRVPNEFVVAPTERSLSMPPSIDLAPPQPGAKNLAEQEMVQKRQQLLSPVPVTTSPSQPLSAGEQALLTQAGIQPQANIRTIVDAESHIQTNDKTILEHLGIREPQAKGDPLDPTEEVKRLKKANQPVAKSPVLN